MYTLKMLLLQDQLDLEPNILKGLKLFGYMDILLQLYMHKVGFGPLYLLKLTLMIWAIQDAVKI